MSDQHVLFLALGGTRRREVMLGAAQATARGAAATVVIDDAAAWQDEAFDARVRVVALAPLELRYLPLRFERFALYTTPRGVVRLIGRGARAGWADRAGAAYERRLADRVHRRLTMPAFRWISGDVRLRLLREQLAQGSPVSAVVIGDPGSIAVAAQLRATPWPGAVGPPPFSFNLAELL